MYITLFFGTRSKSYSFVIYAILTSLTLIFTQVGPKKVVHFLKPVPSKSALTDHFPIIHVYHTFFWDAL